jgi:hypothetical protein
MTENSVLEFAGALDQRYRASLAIPAVLLPLALIVDLCQPTD